ncbi:MAG: efflux RND transporter periplasmic adaptor subunit [Prevotellaceae bacterium]|jgi:HlyD family secretion protein|nr:efflux RND transporter periplasmic adaptor subunit [Prevotellaceae bacterium]
MKTNKKGNLLIGFIILISVVIIITLIGVFALRKAPIVLQGEAEATEVRVSGKLPGRILELRYKEGMPVRKGDTLVIIDSPEISAKLVQAQAAEDAAKAHNMKAIKGARQEQITGTYEQWQKALTSVDLAKKSYNRVQNLYDRGVVAAQKRDEAEANYNAAVATAKVAKSQYDMAVNGAEIEDKEAALALVNHARGAVAEVESYLSERALTAPISGEISDIFPKEGELVGAGSPIMNIVDLSDAWVSFNLREDLLSKIQMGKTMQATVPALGDATIQLEVYYIKAMAAYADWKATKVSGQYDSKTFEVRARPTAKAENLRPGMTVLIEWVKL